MLDSSAESLVLALAALDVGLTLALASTLAPVYASQMLTVATQTVPSNGMEGGMYRETIEAEETKLDDVSLLFCFSANEFPTASVRATASHF